MHSIENTVKKLKVHGAPAALIKLAYTGVAPADLARIWQEPKMFYELVVNYPNNMPFEESLIPLWEVNGDKLVALIDDGTDKVIEYYYEDSKDEFKTIGTGIQSALKESLSWLYFEAEYSESKILSLARELSFLSPEAFVNELEQSA